MKHLHVRFITIYREFSTYKITLNTTDTWVLTCILSASGRSRYIEREVITAPKEGSIYQFPCKFFTPSAVYIMQIWVIA